MGSSRIGRLRYIAYTFVVGVVCLPLILFGDFVTARYESLGIALTLGMQLIVCGLNIMLTVRRLHDFNVSGWWAILEIPLAFFDPEWIGGSPPTHFGVFLVIASALFLGLYVLILLFRPGTPDDNRFGTAPPSNTPWVIAGACAAIVIPLVSFTIMFVFRALA